MHAGRMERIVEVGGYQLVSELTYAVATMGFRNISVSSKAFPENVGSMRISNGAEAFTTPGQPHIKLLYLSTKKIIIN